MTPRAWLVVFVVGAPCVAAGSQRGVLGFEAAARMSDRIAIVTAQGPGGRFARLPDGRDISLGIKEPGSNLVFTPFRVRITECLFDSEGSCKTGDAEVLIPGGTIYETVDGVQRLRTWEVSGAASAPLPPAGEEVLLFMRRRNDRFLPLNDSGARLPIERSSGSASITLRFDSPGWLTGDGQASTCDRRLVGDQATADPGFVESVGIDRLKELIELARRVPTPTSGMRHANADRAHACDSHDVVERRTGLSAWNNP